MTERLIFNSRAEWLAGREAIHGIGASEAAAAIGESRRKSRIDLWREKTGRKEPEDLSGVPPYRMEELRRRVSAAPEEDWNEEMNAYICRYI